MQIGSKFLKGKERKLGHNLRKNDRGKGISYESSRKEEKKGGNSAYRVNSGKRQSRRIKISAKGKKKRKKGLPKRRLF